ncbi:MAG: hypothetical protein QOG23_4636 [Blastocatellia bacterium]|jgi:hypothetical protein|nr:hypothetical protein [Blastocatellia bacterium]
MELLSDELSLLAHLLLMTGREDRLARTPLVDHYQLPNIRAICQKLRSATKNGTPVDARCDLFNRLLLSLSIKTVSGSFFDIVFDGIDFSDDEAILQRVNAFRILCMLEYGNFRFGYKQLRRDDALHKQKWASYFPSMEEAAERKSKFQCRPAPEGLIPIEPFELFALGNLENQQLESINVARETLRRIFTEALKNGVDDFEGLKKVGVARKISKLTSLVAKAGLPRVEELVDLQIANERTYERVLTELQTSCRGIDNDGINRIRADGIQNANFYMAMPDLNVYVATLMRAPLHFTTNWTFVNALFHSGQLSSWNLRYFDPTQTYLQSRIQMGFLERLMIKRTQLMVYRPQESDAFGKDSEAGVVLAQGKPVVAFVTRLFNRLPEMKSLYAALDEATRTIHRDNFVVFLRDQGLLTNKQVESLLIEPERSKADVIETVMRAYAQPVLKKIGSDHLDMELIRHGYVPPDHDVLDFVFDRIIKLERRALTFRDVHPLALQASPIDGVARGVIVTRTVHDTATVVGGLLSGTLTYDIIDDWENWILIDSVTQSPVRVVTKNPVLMAAFWSEPRVFEDLTAPNTMPSCSITDNNREHIQELTALKVTVNEVDGTSDLGLRLSIKSIDQFKNIDFMWTPSSQQFQRLKSISERTVKEVFCSLLSEFEPPNDWGGEECDIFTSNLSIDGERHTAAFLLKGPARFHEMTLADCGKNGDQIYRLYNTGADICVLQHCHRVSPAVRKTMEAFALSQYSQNRRYAIIDGYDTARILRHLGMLP